MSYTRSSEKEIDPSSEKLLDMYRRMVEIRHFEDRIYFLFLQGIMPGTIHLYQGQEAIATGVCGALRPDDVITSTHRPHGHALAKGVPMEAMMAELFGKTTGCCSGKGGSMHMGDLAYGALPAIAIVGGGIPVATGIALAFKFQKSDRVSVSFFGDGATNEGSFHESLNMGAIYNLPVIYVCENNLYGASTHIRRVVKIGKLADRASAYGMPGEQIDGNNVMEVYRSAARAVERARAGQGPSLIECLTYRRGGHSRSDANVYRDKEEEKIWLARDPIVLAEKELLAKELLTQEKIKEFADEVEKHLDQAVEFAKSSPDPQPEDTLKDVFA